MKSIQVFIYLFSVTTFSIAQIAPPGISWIKSDRLGDFPSRGHAATTPIDEITEDWWYDHKNSYKDGEISPENFDGFITCGYSSIANFEQTEDNYGCLSVTNGSPVSACDDELDFSAFPEDYYYRMSFQTIGRYDPHGNLLWYKTYNQGWFIRIIQLSDGNYVACGPTSSTRQPENLYDPILYNPGADNGVFGTDVSMSGCPTPTQYHYGRKLNVVKINPAGEIIWNYIYGINIPEDAADDESIPWDLVEYDIAGDPKIRIVGESYLDPGTGQTNGLMLDINSDDGTINWIEEVLPFVNNVNRKLLAIDKQTVSSTEYLGIAGWEEVTLGGELRPEMFYMDASDVTTSLKIWEQDYTNLTTSLNPIPRCHVTDFVFNSNHDILIPIIFNCNACYNDGRDTYGEAAVYKINSTTGIMQTDVNTGDPIRHNISDGTNPEDFVHAYDLKIGITNTSDDGFAIVTTKVINDYGDTYGDFDWICDVETLITSDDDLAFYNADAFVRKFDQYGNIEWSKSWDIDDHAPAPYPGDQKRQECLYSITETPDGGLVVAGNDSRNFDDSYLVKLYDNCNNTTEADYYVPNGIIDISVLGGNVISSSKKFRSPLVVHYGETLTITGQSTVLEFADSRKVGYPVNLIVETGGELNILDGAKLTSFTSCDNSMWDGIQLWGDPNNNQTSTDEPYLYISEDATIENARYGILADKADYTTHENWIGSNEWRSKDLVMDETQAYGGGFVSSEGGNFTNCRFSIVLNSYGAENGSIIEYSDFNLTHPINDYDAVDENLNPLGINSFIKLYDVHSTYGLVINQNNFIVDYTTIANNDELGTGVGAFDSEYQLTGNYFSGLQYGLNTGASNPLYSFVAKCNVMENMNHGIWMSSIDNAEINNNSITFGDYGHPVGTYIENSTGYLIDQNNFYIGYGPFENSIGMVVYFETPNQNVDFIQNNNFYDIQYDIIAEGELANQLDPTTGLEFSCNEFNNYDFSIAVTLDPGIASNQDGVSNSANNKFESTGCPSSNQGELYNPSPNNSFVYYHKLDNGGYYVEPVSGCFSSSGQVILSADPSLFDNSTDCFLATYDCGPVYMSSSRLTNQTTELQRLSVDTNQYPENISQFNQKMRFLLHHSGYEHKFDSIQSLIISCNLSIPNYLSDCIANISINDSSNINQFATNLDPVSFNINEIFGLRSNYSWQQILHQDSIRSLIFALAMDSAKYGYSEARNIIRFGYSYIIPDVIFLPFNNNAFREKKYNSANITIFPNPFNGQVEISTPYISEYCFGRIYNSLGEEVKNFVLTQELTEIDLSNLTSGIFLLVIYKNNIPTFITLLNSVN